MTFLVWLLKILAWAWFFRLGWWLGRQYEARSDRRQIERLEKEYREILESEK